MLTYIWTIFRFNSYFKLGFIRNNIQRNHQLDLNDTHQCNGMNIPVGATFASPTIFFSFFAAKVSIFNTAFHKKKTYYFYY